MSTHSMDNGPMVKLNKPDGKIEMYFYTEDQAKDRAWAHWKETHPDFFPGYSEEEIEAVIKNWKQSGFPKGYWVSYSMTDAEFFDEVPDDDDYDDEEE